MANKLSVVIGQHGCQRGASLWPCVVNKGIRISQTKSLIAGHNFPPFEDPVCTGWKATSGSAGAYFCHFCRPDILTRLPRVFSHNGHICQSVLVQESVRHTKHVDQLAGHCHGLLSTVMDTQIAFPLATKRCHIFQVQMETRLVLRCVRDMLI